MVHGGADPALHRLPPGRGRDGMELTCTRHDVDELTVITVAGEVDMYTAAELRAVLVDADADGRYRLVLDLTEVRFCDSTGLGVLVAGLRRARTGGGSLRLVDPTDSVLKVLRITGLDRVFPIHDSIDQARAAAARPQPGRP
jgi:anti-sigma B factor antagonist